MDKDADSYRSPPSSHSRSRDASVSGYSRTPSNVSAHGEGGGDAQTDKMDTGDARTKRRPFEVLLLPSRDYLDTLLQNDRSGLRELETRVGGNSFALVDIDIGESAVVHALRVFDEDDDKKWTGATLVISSYVRFCEERKAGNEADIAIPNNMVSLVIGKKGRQILTIMSESGTKINVDQKNKDTPAQYRKVTIKGGADNIVKASKLVVRLVEQMSSKVHNVDYRKRPTIDRSVKAKAKLVLPKDAEEEVLGVDGAFAYGLSKQFNVDIEVYTEKDSRITDRDDSILRIKGRLSDIQDTLVFIIRKLHEFIHRRYDDKETAKKKDVLKLVMSNTYANKLIGKGGSMVREIAARSGGAQIKVDSNREQERRPQDCIVNIAGSLANKQDAACIILEQLEEFNQTERNAHSRDEGRSGSSRSSSESGKAHRRSGNGYRGSDRARDREGYGKQQGRGRSPALRQQRSVSPRDGRDSRDRSYSRSEERRDRRRERSRSAEKPNRRGERKRSAEQQGQPQRESSSRERGVVRSRVVIPLHAVTYLKENDGKKLRSICDDSRCRLAINKEDKEKVWTDYGERGRLLTLEGTPKECADAFHLLQEMILKLEPERRRD